MAGDAPSRNRLILDTEYLRVPEKMSLATEATAAFGSVVWAKGKPSHDIAQSNVLPFSLKSLMTKI